jgi:hypothetical protein
VSLFDHTLPPHQRHSDTSTAAAEAIRPDAGRLRQFVFEAIWGRGELGATDEELQELLDMPANTQRPRRVELVDAGRVRDSGRRPADPERAAGGRVGGR